MTPRALIAGVTGLIGNNLAEHLVAKGWEVHGIARKPQGIVPCVRPIAADLLEPEALRSSLAGLDPPICSSRPGSAGRPRRRIAR
jgi:nucleoside-diphosphate-sugar epimerase